MGLGTRLVAWLLVPLLALAVAVGLLVQHRERELRRAGLIRQGHATALVVQAVARDYLQDRAPAEFTRFVDEVAGYDRVLGLRVFGPDGRLVYQPPALDACPFRDTVALRSVLRERRTVDGRRRLGDRPVLTVLFPLADRQGRLLGAGELLQLDTSAAGSRAGPWLALALALAIATTVPLVVRRRVTGPLAELVRHFRGATAGDPSARVPVRGGDELTQLAAEFNRMCERGEAAQRSLQGEQQMRQQFEGRLRNADRLAGLGRLSAGLAHEIGTPLNVISGRAESLMRHLGDNEAAVRSLRDISTQTERIVHIMSDMLDFARMKPPRRVPTSLEEVVRTVLDMAKLQLARGHVTLQVSLPPDLPLVVADGDQLRQVCLNLALNALDAMQEGGTLTIGAAVRIAPHPDRGGPARRWVAVDFADSGVGIPPENLDRLFDPFFTTKEPGKGTGLGLSVSYGIVREHGGWFDVDSRPGQGTRMTFHLPIEGDAGPDEEDHA